MFIWDAAASSQDHLMPGLCILGHCGSFVQPIFYARCGALDAKRGQLNKEHGIPLNFVNLYMTRENINALCAVLHFMLKWELNYAKCGYAHTIEE